METKNLMGRHSLEKAEWSSQERLRAKEKGIKYLAQNYGFVEAWFSLSLEGRRTFGSPECLSKRCSNSTSTESTQACSQDNFLPDDDSWWLFTWNDCDVRAIDDVHANLERRLRILAPACKGLLQVGLKYLKNMRNHDFTYPHCMKTCSSPSHLLQHMAKHSVSRRTWIIGSSCASICCFLPSCL